MLYPRGGNDRERRLESTCPLRHVCNASIAFFTVLFQREGKRARGEKERERDQPPLDVSSMEFQSVCRATTSGG